MSRVGAMNWLWQYKGKLSIISTPYHDGVHYAKHPTHFIPIIKHLRQLHEQGFVHGDIRAYNMVLQYDAESDQVDCGRNNVSVNDCKGWLIDFDYGGKHAEVEYPKGYRHLLDDGIRPGKEGDNITIMDDWKSLIGLIFHTHTFEIKQGVEMTKDQKFLLFDMEKELERYRRRNVDSNDASVLSDSKLPAKLLRKYIKMISKFYTVELDPNFQSDLSNCGLWQEGEVSNPSHAATGSPQKAKFKEP